MVHKIVQYPITNLNGISKKKVPIGSTVAGVITRDNTREIVHILITEPVAALGQKVEYEEIILLTLSEDNPFNEPDEDKFLTYIGSAVWDKGYRLCHVFQIENIADVAWDESMAEYLPSPPIFKKEDIKAIVLETLDEAMEMESVAENATELAKQEA